MENIICTIIRSLWIPPAIISLLVAAYLLLKRQRETDFLEKDRIERQIKYPVIVFLLCIIFIPIADLLLASGLIPINCVTGGFIISSTDHKITDFSDGSKEKNITFLAEGGFNSDVFLEIPYNAKVTTAELEIEHPPEDRWFDDFWNLSLTGDNEGIDVNQKEGYAFINLRSLEVNGTFVLDGKQVFDEVHVKTGGRLIVGKNQMLSLTVRDILTVDSGGEISVSGRPDAMDEEIGQYLKPDKGLEGSGGGGGGYGGQGGKGGDDATMKGGGGGAPFGFEENPTLIGQPGGRGGGIVDYAPRGVAGTGGYGGGFLRIDAKRMVVDGVISSNGDDGKDSVNIEGTGGGGGGSGGSIILTANTFILNGRISANGGNGGNDREEDGSGGGGGGGRILIVYEKKSGYGSVSADFGTGGKSKDPAKNGEQGGIGTIVWQEKKIEALSVINANITSIVIKPDNLKRWTRFYANTTAPSGSDIKYIVLGSLDGQVLCSIIELDLENGYNITDCAQNEDSIKIRGELVTVTFLRTPRIYDWGVSYETALKGFEADLGTDQVVEYSNPELSGTVLLSDQNTQPKFSQLLTGYARDCTCRGCTPTANTCKVSIRFATKSSGLLRIKNPRIEYTI
jgi:hypothetical protein